MSNATFRVQAWVVRVFEIQSANLLSKSYVPNGSAFNVFCATIDEVHAAMKHLGIVYYSITTPDFIGKILFESPVITEIEAQNNRRKKL